MIVYWTQEEFMMNLVEDFAPDLWNQVADTASVIKNEWSVGFAAVMSVCVIEG